MDGREVFIPPFQLCTINAAMTASIKIRLARGMAMIAAPEHVGHAVYVEGVSFESLKSEISSTLNLSQRAHCG